MFINFVLSTAQCPQFTRGNACFQRYKPPPSPSTVHVAFWFYHFYALLHSLENMKNLLGLRSRSSESLTLGMHGHRMLRCAYVEESHEESAGGSPFNTSAVLMSGLAEL